MILRLRSNEISEQSPKAHSYEVLTPSIVEAIEKAGRTEQSQWLFLEQSEEFRGYWKVDSLWPDYFLDLEPTIGPYRLVSPIGLEDFWQTTKELGYHPLFVDDPINILGDYATLSKVPSISLESSLENTKNGFLPWQIVGYNKLIADESIQGSYVVWDTGSGKTAFIASAIKHHEVVGHPFDLAFVVVKSHNKIDTQRKLLRLAGIESLVIAPTINKRYDVYEEIFDRFADGQRVVLILNYEKFRDDAQALKLLTKNRNCLFFWDEMPTKLSNPDTNLYKGVKKVLYDSFWSKSRPSWMRHWALTATPIENNPGDTWAHVNLLWPGLLGYRAQFESTYGGWKNQFGRIKSWHNLDRLEAKLAFITHRVSEDDPEVREMFPEVVRVPTVIDWGPKQQAIYDRLTGRAKDILADFTDENILAMIQIMQMVCDAPTMVKESANNRERFYELLEQYGDLDEGELLLKGPTGSDVALKLLSAIDPSTLTDVGHTKLEMWKEIILEKHPHEKVVTHSTWAQYIFPVWEYWLQKWGVSYVIYTGTDKKKQDALDAFREDPSIRVFLSGDSGADSIDIPQARVGVNYNIPWKWTTLKQREGRRKRVDSTHETIYTYSLVMPNSVDERKLAVCERKRGYHQALFDGKATEEAITASLTKEELRYIITGSMDHS